MALAATGSVPAQTLPDLGDASQAVLSPAQERKLGEAAMLELRGSGAYLNDPEINAYLNELGQRLAGAVPGIKRDFEFFAVSDFGVNAFALPGGFIGVNAGLLLLAQSESELAAVLAHEISHVSQNHIARLIDAQSKAGLVSMAAMALAILAARSNPEVAQGLAVASQAGLIQSQLDYTREHEREADRIGAQVLEAAGFDTRSMASFMERLQRVTRPNDSGKTPSYLRTHPVSSERIAEALDRVRDRPYRQVKDSTEFHFVRALARSYQGDERAAVAHFDIALKERKFNHEGATRYGLVAALLRAKDYSRAERELTSLEKSHPRHPMIEGMAGQLLLQSGKTKLAIARYETALKVFPSHLQLVYDYPEALLRDQQAKRAVDFLAEELLRHPRDGQLHQLAARGYAALDKRALQHRHQGEYYAWRGNLKGAVEQMELALNSNDGDFYLLSVVG
ncbi:MAG: M48 family metallopeptidase, partial [Burkholderiales bacterium]